MKPYEDPLTITRGDTLPGRVLFGPEQTVAATDLRNGLVTITMEDGWSVTVEWDKPLRFPIREGGVTYDWRTRYPDHPPLASELVPGDLVPLPDGSTDAYQRVARVNAITRRGGLLVGVSTSGPYGPKRYVLGPVEPFVLPRTTYGANYGVDTVTVNRRKTEGRPVFFGPYLNVETLTLWEFTHHPFGRGRWPHDIKPYFKGAHPLINPETGTRFTAEDAIAGRAAMGGDVGVSGAPTSYGCRRARFPATDWDDALEPQADGLPVGRVVKRYGPRPMAWH